jgi:hypothetical protein
MADAQRADVSGSRIKLCSAIRRGSILPLLSKDIGGYDAECAVTPYDAFISYSHAKDKPIAAALQSVVQKLGKPSRAWGLDLEPGSSNRRCLR